MTPEVESFRRLWNQMKNSEPEGTYQGKEMCDCPEPVKELFANFLEYADREDILNCMIALANSERDWDLIAHMFL